MNSSHQRLRPAALALIPLLLAGCSDANSPNGGPTVAFHLATSAAGSASAASGASASLAALPLTLTDTAGHTLVVESAQLVLRQVTFIRADGMTACRDGEHDTDHQGGQGGQGGMHVTGGGTLAPPSGGVDGDEDVADGSDACDAAALGPLLLELPLSPGAAQQFSVDVAPGTYTAVGFHIHKPSSSADAAFLAAHPGFDGVSIRVTGTYDGTPFDFSTSLNAMQHQQFPAPLVVDATGAADVTLMVDLTTWFRTGVDTLLDPTTALHGAANEHLVWQNIKRSFRTFHDANHDGRSDG